MNASRFVSVFSGVCCAVIGCGDPASNDGGSGGQGGDGGAPTTLQSVTSVGGSIGDGGGGGDGGFGGEAIGGSGGAPSACEQTCEKLDACGQPLCGPGGLFNCDADPPTHNTCWLECVDDASCGEINAFIAGSNAPALEACMGACDAGAICKQCIADSQFPGNCSAEVGVCAAEPACAPWVTCAGACTTKACIDGCDTMHPGGAALDGLYDCICNVGYCGDLCAGVFTCPGP